MAHLVCSRPADSYVSVGSFFMVRTVESHKMPMPGLRDKVNFHAVPI